MDQEALKLAVGRMLGESIGDIHYAAVPLHGGTLGDVQLVSGTAETTSNARQPFRVVWKTQKKWERRDDPGSWRREYDLYASGFEALFSDALRPPACYYARINDGEDEMQLCMAYLDGASGIGLTPKMCESAALALGRFQGKLYAERPPILWQLRNLSAVDYRKRHYLRYRSWNEVFDYIRSDACDLPKHICDMLIRFDAHADEAFERIERLPIVFCHRDFWIENIFHSDGKIGLIDWDTAGWGYLGEDIASLIADEADPAHMVECYRKCVPAYLNGFSEYAGIPHIEDPCVHAHILLMFGYRLVEWYQYAETPERRALQLDTLQRIYELRE